jgi:WhiB family redox-sensing transcriptional regulator
MKLDIALPADYPDFEEHGPTPCSQQDPENFFSIDAPDGHMTRTKTYANEAETKDLCRACPYQLRCALYAIKHTEIQGIWGGTTEREREAMRRGRGVKLQRSLGLSPTSRHSNKVK